MILALLCVRCTRGAPTTTTKPTTDDRELARVRDLVKGATP
jgi:hypothetical protein